MKAKAEEEVGVAKNPIVPSTTLLHPASGTTIGTRSWTRPTAQSARRRGPGGPRLTARRERCSREKRRTIGITAD